MSDPDRLDSLGVADAIVRRGRDLEFAADAARRLLLPTIGTVTSVLIDLPAGSSAPGGVGAGVSAVARDSAAVPIIAADDGSHSPMSGDTLVISATAATLERARSLRATVVDLSSVEHHDSFVGGIAATLVVLDRFGLIAEMDANLDEAAAVLDSTGARRGDASKELARRIGRTMPVIYAAGPLGATAGARWKSAVNRYAKAPAFTNAIPGLDVDEICGWAQHGDVTRQVMSLVTLRHGSESEDAARRLISTAETCEEIVADVHEVAATESSPLSQLLELATVGELVAVEMATLAGIDPGPLPVLDRY